MEQTVKVKILVAINDKGNWYAIGHPRPETIDEAFVIESLEEEWSPNYRLVWVEVDVPMPSMTTVQGTVVE